MEKSNYFNAAIFVNLMKILVPRNGKNWIVIAPSTDKNCNKIKKLKFFDDFSPNRLQMFKGKGS